MYYKAANQTVVVQGTAQYSQAFSMQGGNQVLVDFEIIVLTGGGSQALNVTLQEGNDLENWRDVTSLDGIASIGYQKFKTSSGLASQYVRLKFVVSGEAGDKAIVSAGIDTADL